MPLDLLAPSTLLEHDVHRRKHYPYVYFCPACNRSFLAKEPQDSCRLCPNPVRLVTGGKMYVYFCGNCGSRIESDEPKKACETCGARTRTLYRWDALSTSEKKKIKFAKMIRAVSGNLPKLNLRERAMKIRQEEGKKQAAGRKKDAREENKKIKGEELPTEMIHK